MCKKVTTILENIKIIPCYFSTKQLLDRSWSVTTRNKLCSRAENIAETRAWHKSYVLHTFPLLPTFSGVFTSLQNAYKMLSPSFRPPLPRDSMNKCSRNLTMEHNKKKKLCSLVNFGIKSDKHKQTLYTQIYVHLLHTCPTHTDRGIILPWKHKEFLNTLGLCWKEVSFFNFYSNATPKLKSFPRSLLRILARALCSRVANCNCCDTKKPYGVCCANTEQTHFKYWHQCFAWNRQFFAIYHSIKIRID
jgi:hypothetical protein